MDVRNLFYLSLINIYPSYFSPRFLYMVAPFLKSFLTKKLYISMSSFDQKKFVGEKGGGQRKNEKKNGYDTMIATHLRYSQSQYIYDHHVLVKKKPPKRH